MDKQKTVKVSRDSFNLEDAFKIVFFLLVSVSLLSVAFTVILMVIAESKGLDFTAFYITKEVQIVALAFTPIIFIAFFFVYCKMSKINIKHAMSDDIKKSLLPVSIAIVLSIICIFLLSPFISLIEHVFRMIGFTIDDTIPYFMYMKTEPLHLLIGIFLLGFVTAVAEEIIFRGVVLRGLCSKFGAVTSIILSSVLFTLAHGGLDQTVYQMIMGVILAYLALVGGSIMYPVILHFLNNTLVILLNVYDGIDYLNSNTQFYDNIWQVVFPILLFLLAVSLIAILFWVLKYLRNKHYFVKHTEDESKSKEASEKMSLLDFWKYSVANEKVYMVACVGFSVLMWIINTLNSFTG